MGKKFSNLPTSINLNDKIMSNNKDIAEEFNNYFSNIVRDLSAEIGPPFVSFETFLPEPVPFSFFPETNFRKRNS